MKTDTINTFLEERLLYLAIKNRRGRRAAVAGTCLPVVRETDAAGFSSRLHSSTFCPSLTAPLRRRSASRKLFNTNKLSRSFTAAPSLLSLPVAIMKSLVVLSLVASLAVAQSSVCHLFPFAPDLTFRGAHFFFTRSPALESTCSLRSQPDMRDFLQHVECRHDLATVPPADHISDDTTRREELNPKCLGRHHRSEQHLFIFHHVRPFPHWHPAWPILSSVPERAHQLEERECHCRL